MLVSPCVFALYDTVYTVDNNLHVAGKDMSVGFFVLGFLVHCVAVVLVMEVRL